jgi:hypothetical protein
MKSRLERRVGITRDNTAMKILSWGCRPNDDDCLGWEEDRGKKKKKMKRKAGRDGWRRMTGIVNQFSLEVSEGEEL